MATAPEQKSAIGPANNTPSIPIKRGSIRRGGRKKRNCLVRERKTPFMGFPIEVKKVAIIGWRQFSQVKKRKTLKKLSPKRK